MFNAAFGAVFQVAEPGRAPRFCTSNEKFALARGPFVFAYYSRTATKRHADPYELFTLARQFMSSSQS
jgi:hypothetical protein